jgi:DNA-binding NarL/FixJ family response regulator
MPRNDKIKLTIIDDCVIFRTGLFLILSKNDAFKILNCSDFQSSSFWVERKGGLPEDDVPDVILAHTTVKDITYQNKTVERAKKAAPKAKVLLISEFSDMDYLVKILMSSCDGYVLRDVSEQALVRAIKNVNSEIFVFDRGVIEKFLKFPKSGGQVFGQSESLKSELSERENKVIAMVAEGMTNRTIAAELGLAAGTVKNMISDMLARFGFKKRSQLVTLLAEAYQASTR